MVFEHRVVHNGIAYPAGTDVPIEDNNGEGVKAPAVDVSGKVEVEEEVNDIPFISKYSEKDLDVPIQVLRKMCKENGIKMTNKDNADSLREKLRAL